jgi:hypothetical protein
MGKRKIAILNIDSILNNFFGPSEVPKCLLKQFQNEFTCWIRLRNGCVRAKRKKQWLMAPSPLIRHFEVLKKKSSTIFFLYNVLSKSKFNWFASNLTKLWKIYAWRPSWFSPPFCIFLLQFIFFISFNDFNFQNISSDIL